MKKYIFIKDWFSIKKGTVKWYDEGTAKMLKSNKAIEDFNKPVKKETKSKPITKKSKK